MNNANQERKSAVAIVRSVRDQLSREIEEASGAELLDRIRGHRYTSPLLQRLASKAAAKAEASVAAAARH
jgi:hypothetical protein